MTVARGEKQTIIKSQATVAPEFKATDSEGRTVQLSDYRGKKHVVLVFNRGFG
jgi:peroxiredoxin